MCSWYLLVLEISHFVLMIYHVKLFIRSELVNYRFVLLKKGSDLSEDSSTKLYPLSHYMRL